MTEQTVARKGPLTDLRVIEMGQLIAGPFCGQLFAISFLKTSVQGQWKNGV